MHSKKLEVSRVNSVITAKEAHHITLKSKGYDVELWWSINKGTLSQLIKLRAEKGERNFQITEANCSRIGMNFKDGYYVLKLAEELTKLDYHVDTSEYNIGGGYVEIQW